MELDSLYQEVILDHYKNPQNKHLESDNDAQVHHVNPSCGDEITLNVSMKEGVVESVSWDGVGCSISQASISIASELLKGRTFESAQALTDEFVDLMQSKGKKTGNEATLEDAVALAGVSQYPARIKCALLGWMAIKDASLQAQSK
mgnify:CR=1 FL=1